MRRKEKEGQGKARETRKGRAGLEAVLAAAPATCRGAALAARTQPQAPLGPRQTGLSRRCAGCWRGGL